MQIKLVLAFIAACTAVAAVPVENSGRDLSMAPNVATGKHALLRRQDDDDGDDGDNDDGDDGDDGDDDD
ncbi:hypothetical protein VP1G_06266 [Cytospora mali]|uniref:Uncharacterized protein n=1 Tax=Cytospora mali TaxID=578113 RepID=A0A194V4U1_CYTMA|nr:hypothetical protein VP1G_06266 [Valsa mali var. pyri (nom. inval.)]